MNDLTDSDGVSSAIRTHWSQSCGVVTVGAGALVSET